MSTPRTSRSKSVTTGHTSSPEHPLFPISGRATSVPRRRRLVGPSTSIYRPDVRPPVSTWTAKSLEWKWYHLALRLYTVFQALHYQNMQKFYMVLMKRFLPNQTIGSGDNRVELDIAKQTQSTAKMIQSKGEPASHHLIKKDPIFRVIWNKKLNCKEVATYPLLPPGK